MSTIYKLKDSIIIISIINRGSTLNLQLPISYTVIYTVPELTAFTQTGPLNIDGPQKATIILPISILPQVLIDQLISRVYAGTFREILPSLPPGVTTLQSTDLEALTSGAITKEDEYEIKSTNSAPPSPTGKKI